MYKEEFSKRIAALRQRKGISARDMSLSLDQNPGYINNIESGKALPSMSMFFAICEFLHVTPAAFFDLESDSPRELADTMENLKKLSPEDFEHISSIIKSLAASSDS